MESASDTLRALRRTALLRLPNAIPSHT